MKKAKVFVLGVVLCMVFVFTATCFAAINKSGESNKYQMDLIDDEGGGNGGGAGTSRRTFEIQRGPWFFEVTYTVSQGTVVSVSVKADNIMNRASVSKWIQGSRYVEVSGAYRDCSKGKWVEVSTGFYLM